MVNTENLGPAERIIQALVQYTDHAVHNRPGYTVPDARTHVGVRWAPVTHKEENGEKVVYVLTKNGKKSVQTKLGVLQPNNQIKDGTRVVGTYRPAGLFPEVVTWMYKQVAEIWKLDNEFAAHWASYAFEQDHRDLKVILAAFMLVQSRKGDPVIDGGKVAFYDDDFRDVGEAMALLQKKDKDLNPKLLLRIYDILTLPSVAQINRELGFGKSARHAFTGRWEKAVQKWLEYREENPRLLEGLKKAGFRRTVIRLATRIGYKPTGPNFFKILGWKQKQAKDGRRQIAIGQTWAAAETWEGMTETDICKRIVETKPNWKVVTGRVPSSVGITRAILAASIDAGSLSNKDLIILTPTMEELGLLQVPEYKTKWEQAAKAADDMRAANIASRVKSKETKEKLEESADTALKKAVEEVTKGIRVYFMVDISGSMQGAIEAAKDYLAKLLQGFPPDKIHISIFNTAGREVVLKSPSAAGVRAAFQGFTAGGGTEYSAGITALQHHKPTPDEDVIFIWIGDERNHDNISDTFEIAVQRSGLNPMAFGLIRIEGTNQAMTGGRVGTFANRYEMNEGKAVRDTAARLGIPCFLIDNDTFSDVYAIPRTIRNLIASTPVNQVTQRTVAPRLTLVDTILKTPLLVKPAWAA